ncbi:anti-sigma-K factor RskA [Tamlana nanhaiensis]|uniref:Anti-sigma-K factor RskA n=1 Tax=Neotamlana nanhaiensis TaxID=1382798 RepID=A0A0D7VZ99_9FLAO|nr:anti-sigma factor [Tamlana nanhaiensis]KJD32058.1 anti-sigma-K factor RskA [Tamlana nanhaiensis]KJD32220.1 anti-sigma-K factor RskA [Tamlana nanhaiensis]
MEEIKNYIESGILEMYVAGALSEKENREVYQMMLQHPEILQEVLEIESAVVKLTASVAPTDQITSFSTIRERLIDGGNNSKVISINKPKYNWVTYTGWAASIVLAGGLLWTLSLNKTLENDIKVAETQQELLETQIEKSKNSLTEAHTLISVLRDDNITQVPLAGQGNFASTYAKVYWDKTKQLIFLDAQGLPEPPEGKVYQVWSLTLAPLTPTSLGTIDSFTTDENKIFEIENANESEAFGITLEPAGGSETPTMEQLYTLGVVES